LANGYAVDVDESGLPNGVALIDRI